MFSVIHSLSGYLWGFPMIALLFCTHIFMTVKTGGIQRKTLRGLRLSLSGSDKGEGDLSPFEALSTTLASTIGTGNIIGVGTAIYLGGAGAVFWCWLTGVLGMATQYAEVLLSVKFSVKDKKGSLSGGPMYVLRYGLNNKLLALFYAVLASGAVLITGSVVQSNAVCAVVDSVFSEYALYIEAGDRMLSVASLITALILGFITVLTIFSSLSRLGSLCAVMVPFMGGLYILASFLILFINRDYLWETLKVIFRSAFTLRAAGGGFLASGIMLSARYGVSRGLFSNEAGLGTSGIVSASSKERNPVTQGLVSMTATFWDTVVMCAVTGLVIVSSLLSLGGEELLKSAKGEISCYLAFSRIPIFGKGVLVFSLCLFAFSTIVGLSCVGLKCSGYFLHERGQRIYLILWAAGVFASPFIPFSLLWEVADILNALLVFPNVYGLMRLCKTVKRETDEYFR